MSTFEDLLNNRFPNGTMHEEVIMDLDITFKDEDKKEDGSTRNMQFANGNAQLRDFFKMVGYICESAMDDLDIQYIPYESAMLYKRDADYRLNKDAITYRVKRRVHSEGTSYKPRDTSSMLVDDGHAVTRYTEYFTSTVQFCFMSTNYDKAWDMMDRFEEIMNSYSSHIRGAGIVDYWFEEQEAYVPDIDFREIVNVFVLNYKVKTERNVVITNEGINKVNIQGKVVHDCDDCNNK